MKARRHNAYHSVGSAAESDSLADQGRIGAEAAPPESVADEDDLVAAGTVFFFQECATQARLYAEDREQTGVDLRHVHAHGVAAAGEVCSAGLVSGEVLEGLALLLDVQKLGF